MRIYTNPFEAVREVERDLFEMGIEVHPQTMQDKDVADDPDYKTLEVRGYGFKVVDWRWNFDGEEQVIKYLFKKPTPVLHYLRAEFLDRISGKALNPGNSYLDRKDIWDEFLHLGKFAYTYSERMAPQVARVIEELTRRPDTRQAIINIHSNICVIETSVWRSHDLLNMGGSGRVPCSMYYQLMIREGKLDLIYSMRSCDFLVHFPVDIMLALRLQSWTADQLKKKVGTFTYFTGSLHAYYKDMKERGIF